MIIKLTLFTWAVWVFYSVFPGSNPLNIIFSIIFISSFLFLLFAYKGGSSMGFLWVLVYMGGMLIVFLYLIFLTMKEGGSELVKHGKFDKKKKNSFLFQVVIMSSILFLFFKLNFFGGGSWLSSVLSLGGENQEFYSLFMSISRMPVFGVLLLVISMSLFLYLGILNKKMLQSKISFFFHFIMKYYMKFPILSSLWEMKMTSFIIF